VYRSKHSNKATVQEVLKDLQKNNIDVSQLVAWPAHHCQQAESLTARGSSA